jgi:hypothetical protein
MECSMFSARRPRASLSTNRRSIPRRYRSYRECCTGSVGMQSRATYAHSHLLPGSHAGIRPARYWPCAFRPARSHRPKHIPRFPARPARQIPIPTPSAVLARPSGVGERIRIGDMHHGMIVETVNVALWTVRVTPVGPFEEGPPFPPTAHVNRAYRRSEHQ